MDSLFEKVKTYLLTKGASRIEIFGSRARKDNTAESDLDVLVAFKEKQSLLSLVGYERELSELLGVKVDLVTEKSIHPLILDRIKEDRIVLY